MADNNRSGSMSGLSEAEAREFHGIFITSFIAFTVVAIIAQSSSGNGVRGSQASMVMPHHM